MLKLIKLVRLASISIVLIALPQVSNAANALDLVCKGGLIDEQVLRSLYQLGDDIQAGKKSLNLPAECMESMEIELNNKKITVANPYVVALKMAAGVIKISEFAAAIKDPEGDLGKYTAINRVSLDNPMVSYLRIGCGTDRKCVSTVLNAIEGFHAEKSPIFCDFSPKVDASVAEYFKSISFLPMPVYCMHHSSLGGNHSIPAKSDWYEAFKQLGDNDGR